MAEGFANHYGADVLTAKSAGLSPIDGIPPGTVEVMFEQDIDVSRHVPQLYNPLRTDDYDIVVNMSGFRLPGPPPKELIDWKVRDPYGSPMDIYRVSRGEIEQRVMRLILELRRRAKP
jgi:arsenate reductase